MFFFYNVIISTWAFACWYFAGLGPSLLLLPKNMRHQAIFLAPLIGMCFLTLIGIFQIGILLVPLTPRFNVGILWALSFPICLWFYYRSPILWVRLILNLIQSFLPALTLLLLYSWMFHNAGFHLLVGSSDQLQYCENTRQILEVMHTGSYLDVPISRQEYFVYDMITHLQPYLKFVRRGAEVLLATTKSSTGLSYYGAFPVTVLNSLLTLILSTGFLGRALKLSHRQCLLLQFCFLISFYLLLLHVQGSLAMLVGMAPGIITLVLLSYQIKEPSWRWILLTSITMAAYLSIYSEPSLVNIFLPCLIFLLWESYHSLDRFFLGLRSISLIFSLVFLMAPYAIYSVIVHTIVNIYGILSPYLIGQALPKATHLISAPSLKIWNLAPVVLGMVSYYDFSPINNMISNYIALRPILALLGFIIFCGSALLGYFKAHNLLARLLSIPLIFWTIASLIFAYGENHLYFARSLHYSMTYAIIGLVMLISQYEWRVFKKQQLISILCAGIACGVLGFYISTNIYTIGRTVRFITSHDVKTDPILIRFDERSMAWQQLKSELSISASQNTPVLISGFQDTIRPLAISIIIRNQSHVLGTSILDFWQVYESQSELRAKPYWPFSYEDFSMFNTRRSPKVLKAIQQQESRPWEDLEYSLIELSQQAVVPINHGYPIEWLESKDRYEFQIKHIPNICDVVSRKRQFSST